MVIWKLPSAAFSTAGLASAPCPPRFSPEDSLPSSAIPHTLLLVWSLVVPQNYFWLPEAEDWGPWHWPRSLRQIALVVPRRWEILPRCNHSYSLSLPAPSWATHWAPLCVRPVVGIVGETELLTLGTQATGGNETSVETSVTFSHPWPHAIKQCEGYSNCSRLAA
jgi:hypothetical protein